MVYEIGLYVMDGFGSSQIARKLTERRILTPPPYYASRGRKASTTKQGLPYAWDASTVADCGSVMYQCRATNFRREQEYYLCASYRKSRDFCGQTYSIRTDIPELTPCILHEFVEKIIVHAASDPKGKTGRRSSIFTTRVSGPWKCQKSRHQWKNEKGLSHLRKIIPFLWHYAQ